MSDNSDRAAWQATTDREQIREWAEDHETVPVLAEGRGLRLLSASDDRGERLSWDEFFERLETESLALRYRETETRGADQPAYELVDRDEITEETGSEQEAPDGSDAQTHGDAGDQTEPTPPGAEGTGVTQVDSETAAQSEKPAKESDTRSEEGEDDDRNTAMSVSSRDAEAGAFVLDEIHEARGLGDDAGEEYLTFRNTGDEALDLSGWVVENEDGQRFVFPEGFTLADENVTLYSGSGSDTESDLYWGATDGVWDDDGDTIVVKTADGQEVLREPYLK